MTGSIHLLHVDDEPDFAEMAAEFLEREDDSFTVETATSALGGLERLANDDFDCIVSDYEMPGQNGIEFLETVREEYPDLPFILYTGKGSEEVASDAISAGVTDYLQKESGTDQYRILANRIRNYVERARAEREREAMRERMDLALEHTDSVIYEIDLATGAVRRLGEFEHFFGVPPEEVPTWEDHLDQAVHPDDRDKFREFHQQLAEGERDSGTLEYRTCPDGDSVRWIRDDVHVRDDEPRQAIGLARDITQRKEREQALRRERDFIDQAIDTLPDIFYVIGPDGEMRRWNEKLTDVTGYTDDDVKDMDAVDFFSQDDQERVAEGIEEALTTGYTTVEADLLTVYGDRISYEFTGTRLTNTEGDLAGLVGIGRDISERKAREEELARKESLLDAQQEAVLDGMLVVDEDANIVSYNDRFIELWGVPEEIIEQGDDEAALNWARDQLVNPNEFREKVEYLYEHPEETARDEVELTDGRVFDRYTTPLTGEDGTHFGRLWTFRDITDGKEREQKLQRKNKRLEKFTSVVSHDLRNPLNVAQGRLELAKDECQSAHLDAVADAHERMETLIKDLLTLAREGMEVSDVTTVELSNVIESCWRSVETHTATLKLETTETIHAAPDRLRQLLENLFRNSVEHGGEAVTVTVGDLDEKDGFYVADDGPGIPTDKREQVFDAGYSTTDNGIGFGLNIVQEIAQAHGWKINVTDSEVGGARFEVAGVSGTAE